MALTRISFAKGSAEEQIFIALEKLHALRAFEADSIVGGMVAELKVAAVKELSAAAKALSDDVPATVFFDDDGVLVTWTKNGVHIVRDDGYLDSDHVFLSNEVWDFLTQIRDGKVTPLP